MALGAQVTFDAADPSALAEFWALALDYQLQPPPPGFGSWEAFGEHTGIPREEWDAMPAVSRIGCTWTYTPANRMVTTSGGGTRCRNGSADWWRQEPRRLAR